jgi:hypothetical protein
MNITSKIVVPNKEWLIRDSDKKIGSISKIKKGFQIWKKGISTKVKSIDELKENIGIDILPNNNNQDTVSQDKTIYGFPCSSTPYEPVYNLKKKLPIFTKSLKSKSHFCAGYYAIKFQKGWVRSFCPKLITLERYPFEGPFKTEQELKNKVNILNKES